MKVAYKSRVVPLTALSSLSMSAPAPTLPRHNRCHAVISILSGCLSQDALLCVCCKNINISHGGPWATDSNVFPNICLLFLTGLVGDNTSPLLLLFLHPPFPLFISSFLSLPPSSVHTNLSPISFSLPPSSLPSTPPLLHKYPAPVKAAWSSCSGVRLSNQSLLADTWLPISPCNATALPPSPLHHLKVQ